ncbi:MAG: ATP synthase F1 subunit gamma [Candidatus Peribacteraceae bacterium]|nr:ATP synthase F1 subunit gamma [Candidatus Peribacteraceae bacterium]
MARSLRDLRRKMKAIKSTKQVTKAMELVAASKMRRAVLNATLLRKYAMTAWAILQKIALSHRGKHPWLVERPVRRILAIIITSDRGLCGSLNTQLFRSVTHYIKACKELEGFEQLDFIAVGRKGQQFLKRADQKVVGAFPALSNHPSYKDVLPVAKMGIDGFVDGTYDHVVLLYTEFLSALVQEPATKLLLPFSESGLRDMIRERFVRKRLTKEEEQTMTDIERLSADYLFEPGEEEVLNRILPQLTEMQIYQAVLESTASEHSARMLAMRNATDNATEILDDLTLTYNQTRQANITAELAELSGAAAALEK